MKTLLLVLFGAMLYAVPAEAQTRLERQEERKEARETAREDRAQRREGRAVRREREIDSLVQNGEFKFTPRTMQRQPAGQSLPILDAEYGVTVSEDTIDIDLPYLKNNLPPYERTVIDYTIPALANIEVERDKMLWRVRFDSTLFSAANYTFRFEIYPSGDAVLEIDNTWYNTVRYEGTIYPVY